MSDSPQSRCRVCRKFIPAWDLHLRCIAHWDRDCSKGSPCDVCAVWSDSQWTAVDKAVAKIEAKAVLKVSGQSTKKARKVSPTDASGERPAKRTKKSHLSPDTVFYNPKSFVSSNRSPETKRRETALAYGRSQESTQGVDSRYVAAVDTAPVSTIVDTGSSDTTVVKPQTTQGLVVDTGRDMPKATPNRGCKEALVSSVSYSAAPDASGTDRLLSPIAGVGMVQAADKSDSRAHGAGFTASHPVVTDKPGHGFTVLADGVREQPCSNGLSGPWLDNQRSRSVASTGRGKLLPTATVTTAPVPGRWSVPAEHATVVAQQSPVRTPGHGGYGTPCHGVPLLPLLSPEDLEGTLRQFSTPSTERHAIGTPPGFFVPPTPRERLARARMLRDFIPPPVEVRPPVARGEWPPVARQDEPVVRDSSMDCSSHDLSYLPFASKVSLVRDILGDKVPVPVDSSDSTQVRSLLSRGPDPVDSFHDRLPLAGVVRSALVATEQLIASTVGTTPQSTRPSDGLPLSLRSARRVMKYYKVSSPDFVMSSSTTSGELNVNPPPVSVSSKLCRSMEEHVRGSLACGSTSEWFLAAVSSILLGCQDAVATATSLEDLRESVSTSLTSSLDLLSSAGVAVQDGTLSTATVLGELTLARRDSLIRRLGSASAEFKDRLRVAPLVGSCEPTEKPDGAGDLFAGLASGLREDRRQEASHLSTELVLRAYYGKDRRGTKRSDSPRRGSSQAKKPRAGPSFKPQSQRQEYQPERQPFSGPPEPRSHRGGRPSRGSFPSRRGNRFGRR